MQQTQGVHEIIGSDTFLKIYYASFGCKVNRYETEVIEQTFEKRGDTRAASVGQAQVCVINSCTVTAQADAKLREFISSVRRENPQCLIALTGCFPQAFPEKAAELSADIISGSGQKTSLPDMVYEYLMSSERQISVGEVPRSFEPMTLSHGSRTRAFVKIQDGCDMFCTYCVIPYARGHIRSKPLEDIRREVNGLVSSGHREIVLTGINLCCYGREMGLRLVDAVEAACAAGEGHRVRLSSIEPEMLSDEDIARLAALDKLCPHFHLSMQSGCDRVLRAMNRHYNTAEYAALVGKLRKAFPDCAITTDIMAGFPTETEEEHAETMAFIRRIGFAQAHVFPYSERSGTKAAEMDGRLDGGTKARRAREITAVCKETAAEYTRGFVGKTVEVLFERERGDGFHRGHSREYLLVWVAGEGSWHKQTKRITITESFPDHCVGVEVKEGQ